MTTELIEKLEGIAASEGLYDDKNPGKRAKILGEAIETIRSLSEKLHAANMERSSAHYHNGWIPCDERMPEEHDSMFSRYVGTSKWNKSMWAKQSDNVLVTVEFENGARRVMEANTHDGDFWFDPIKVIKRKAVAWMPSPEPYREDELRETGLQVGEYADKPTLMPGA